jgi:glutathione reductase (NADPH)
MARFEYGLFVIGGGSGGVRAARLAAGLGVKTAIAEEHRFGGTCVIRGCVPKKLLVYASEFGHALEDARAYGWQVPEVAFDWPTLIANKDQEIERISQVYRRNVGAAGAEIIESRAEVVDEHTVRILRTDRTVTAERILIATGGHPFIPDVPGKELGITSNEAFHLEALPRRIVIAGAGYIAIEFACIFAGLGSQVHLMFRADEILRGFDGDMRRGLSHIMREGGITLSPLTEIASIAKQNGALTVALKSGSQVETDAVMFATGRNPNTVGLGLQKLGVECGWNGSVIVDDFYRSSIPSICAVGDVTDHTNLTPVAIRDAIAFVEGNYKNNPKPVDLTFLPTAVFSQPEIGTVGMTEELARDMYPELDIYKSSFRPLKNTITGRTERMLMKLIVDRPSDRIVGCHILGPGAAEMAQLVAISLKLGARKADFDSTIALHPTLAEELVTMREKWQPEG